MVGFVRFYATIQLKSYEHNDNLASNTCSENAVFTLKNQLSGFVSSGTTSDNLRDFVERKPQVSRLLTHMTKQPYTIIHSWWISLRFLFHSRCISTIIIQISLGKYKFSSRHRILASLLLLYPNVTVATVTCSLVFLTISPFLYLFSAGASLNDCSRRCCMAYWPSSFLIRCSLQWYPEKRIFVDP